MQVNVLIFGKLKEITGTHSCTITDVNDTASMIAEMNRMYPGLREMKYLVAVEKDIVHDNTPLRDNFTVALLPPYSGG